MSRQLSQNQDMNMAKELRAEFSKNRSSSGSVRGGRGGSRGRRSGGSVVPPRVKSPSSTGPMFTSSSYTARRGVGTSFPGRGGFSPVAASVALSTSSVNQENQPPPHMNRQENQHMSQMDRKEDQPISYSDQLQVLIEYREDKCTSNDIDMEDGGIVPSTQNVGQKPRVSKHGGIEQSRWAGRGRQEMHKHQEQRSDHEKLAEFNKRMKNWIPSRIAHPTPPPPHLAQDSQLRSQTIRQGTTAPSHGNPLGTAQGNTLTAGTRRTAPRGGLANSQWAT
ncbi:hypothetical protein G7054_g5533 [Neopestalotiopsis clavispora]|nr:hypothetical protein G7054_g5533 [Neopestalotiopsis clavispora]